MHILLRSTGPHENFFLLRRRRCRKMCGAIFLFIFGRHINLFFFLLRITFERNTYRKSNVSQMRYATNGWPRKDIILLSTSYLYFHRSTMHDKCIASNNDIELGFIFIFIFFLYFWAIIVY